MREGLTQSADTECMIRGRKVPVRFFASPRYDDRNQVIGAVTTLQDNSEDQRFADELSRLVKASLDGQLQELGKREVFQGRYRELMTEFDVFVDKLNWYQSIIDAVQFPIHVIDKDMNWVS